MVRKELDCRVRHYGLRPPPAADNVRANTAEVRTASTAAAGRAPRAFADSLSVAEADPIRTILVPLDGSPFGEYALPLAAGIARRAGAKLRVMHVHTPLGPDELPVRHYFGDDRLHLPYGLCGRSRGSRLAYLDDVTNRLARTTAVTAEPHLYDGWDVGETLRSATIDADLVVMANRGRGRLGRLWHGSVADDFVQRSLSPVLLVRGGEGPPDPGFEPAVRRVLLPLDGTPENDHVVRPAAALAAVMGAEVTLLGTPPLQYYGGPRLAAYRAGGLPRPTDPGLPAMMCDALERCAARLTARGLAVEMRAVSDDRSVAAVVLDFARRRPADLIALTQRRGGLMRFLFGSTADRVIRGAAVPVLVADPNES
jgi:nucleotide-binding universal stress UspA family protein